MHIKGHKSKCVWPTHVHTEIMGLYITLQVELYLYDKVILLGSVIGPTLLYIGQCKVLKALNFLHNQIHLSLPLGKPRTSLTELEIRNKSLGMQRNHPLVVFQINLISVSSLENNLIGDWRGSFTNIGMHSQINTTPCHNRNVYFPSIKCTLLHKL